MDLAEEILSSVLLLNPDFWTEGTVASKLAPGLNGTTNELSLFIQEQKRY
jgi:hypothetical protein